ncbi:MULTISPECIES: DUF4424 domain-containing protein [Rhizobium]|uniref:DUF4424 domain-containing protein n=1 Tax=Rhizobium rhododendri TaxID=2506430 RepID=A0ABY8IQH2_9HYPH|nr:MULTISPECIES: DUF4424 domain-containing protein [Rhizobium]TQX85194.1 DUF4424 domain-containing protein [Rhizobium sp. rho-13.1]TQY09482.1 DUF4424 domain-containing protein [Rhizobium sp. rho-1.1]WFS25964.1 DUF4424 domain-containing protein [Rhizobium rhododendri]
MRNKAVVCLFVLVSSSTAFCDDSSATLGAGGLVLQKTDKVTIVSEDLYLSLNSIRVSYRFRNVANTDFTTTIAFPMPDFVGGGSNSTTVVPDPASDNFMKFQTLVDGQPIEAQLEQRAFLAADGVADIEITERLKALHIPLVPTVEATQEAISKLTNAQRKNLVENNFVDTGDAGDYGGQSQTLYPVWTLRSKYWRNQTFPVGREIAVQQTYVPVLGSQSSLSFGSPDMDADRIKSYREKFCTDAAFTKAAHTLYSKAADDNGKSFQSFEQYLSYVIKSGGNWAGPIGSYRLVVDKGDPKTLVSFCGDGVKKIGPTQFELKSQNYKPERDIDILLLRTVPVD